MRTDRGAPARSSPSPEPIRIEFYGSGGPGLRPAVGEAPPASSGGGRRGRTLAAIVAVALVLGVAAVAVGAATDRTGRAEREPAVALDAGAARPLGPPDLATLPPAVAATLPFPGGAVGPGRYASDLLGLPLEFAIADATALRTARPGTILLTPVGTAASTLEDAPHVQFVRLAGWNTRAEAGDRTFRGVGGIDPHEVDAWIADNDVIVERRSRRLVDGRRARVLQLRVDPASALGEEICAPSLRPCFWFASVAEDDIMRAAIRLDHPLSGAMTIRLWLIEIPGEHPVLVEAAAPAGLESFLDRVEATTIATLEIGETAAERLAGAGTGIPASD